MQRLWLLLLGLITLQTAHAVALCDDQEGYPPFSYQATDGRWHGASYDLIVEIFRKAGLPLEHRLLPWKRCLALGAQGKEIEVVANASLNPERLSRFYASRALHRDQTVMWATSNNSFPASMDPPSDLQLCGIHGYNYNAISREVRSRLDLGCKSTQCVLGKLRRGHCQIFIGERFSTLRAVHASKDLSLPDLHFRPLPTQPGFSIHLLIAKASPRAQELQQRLDQALLELQQEGEDMRIYRRYMSVEEAAQLLEKESTDPDL